MLNLILFGPPGAGKGTQSEKIIAKYKLIHLSTGDLLRSEIQGGTELGLRAKTLMDQGLLVPDEVVIGMIDNKLKEHKGCSGFYFRRISTYRSTVGSTGCFAGKLWRKYFCDGSSCG